MPKVLQYAFSVSVFFFKEIWHLQTSYLGSQYNKGWEIRVRVRVLGGVELILLWKSDVGNVGEDDDGRASGHRAVCKRIRVLTLTLDDNLRWSRSLQISPGLMHFFRSSCFLSRFERERKKKRAFLGVMYPRSSGLWFVLCPLFLSPFCDGFFLFYFFPLLSSWWFFIFWNFLLDNSVCFDLMANKFWRLLSFIFIYLSFFSFVVLDSWAGIEDSCCSANRHRGFISMRLLPIMCPHTVLVRAQWGKWKEGEEALACYVVLDVWRRQWRF